MKNGKMKLKLFDKVFVIIFIISSIISLNSYSIWIGGHYDCYPISDRNMTIINKVFGLSYLIQLYILSLLFFHKLQLICNGTIIKISLIATYFYQTIFSLLPIYIFICLFLVMVGVIPKRIGYGLAIIFVFFYILLMISIAALIISKLIRVYRGMRLIKQNTEFMVESITKIAILNTTALLCTFINISIYLSSGLLSHPLYLEWINTLMGTTDIYYNFICIMLCLSPFKTYYKTLCSRLHGMCRICWTRIAGIDVNEIHIQREIDVVVSDASRLSDVATTNT